MTTPQDDPVIQTEENTEVTEQISSEISEEGTAQEPNEPEKSNFPTQMNLTIRAIVGGYVTYLAYEIITSESEMTPLMWAAVAVFIFAGVGLIAMSIKHFICGEYEGGKKDI